MTRRWTASEQRWSNRRGTSVNSMQSNAADSPGTDPRTTDPDHDQKWNQLLAIMHDRGLIRFDEPRQLSSGEMSLDFIDAKRALSFGADLWLAAGIICDSVTARGIEFSAAGGLTMGADHLAHAVALYRSQVLGSPTEWFVVRKAPKGRGTNQTVEGAALSPESKVLLLDDIVTTGGSIIQAYERVTQETGATVVAAVTMVDRSGLANKFFADQGVPYLPVFTYSDLGIDPIGQGSAAL